MTFTRASNLDSPPSLIGSSMPRSSAMPRPVDPGTPLAVALQRPTRCKGSARRARPVPDKIRGRASKYPLSDHFDGRRFHNPDGGPLPGLRQVLRMMREPRSAWPAPMSHGGSCAVHMNPEEAVQAHVELGRPLSVATHFGTFQLTSEPIDEPVRALADARRAQGVPPGRFRALAFGESLLLP